LAEKITVLAGSTGHLGGLIARAPRDRGARLRALVRPLTPLGKIADLRRIGADVVEVDFEKPEQLARACTGGSCVVSALAGLRDTIVRTQSALLDAAVKAKVPRFIPSDFAIDFYRMPDGYNRNLDHRREFSVILDRAPIAATSVLNGMFMDLLAGQAPFILSRFHRALYWDNPDQPMDFTTIEDVAWFTAAAALEPTTPRFLRIAGGVASARDLARIAAGVKGAPFKLFRAGSLKRLERIIRFMQVVMPARDVVYPPWQGMHNMFDGRAKLTPLDNDRYGRRQWTSIKELLGAA
jgi:nucleoside-diphosphate-sugar epimerase